MVRGGFLCARTIYRERGRTTKPLLLLLFHRCARTRESISILPGNLTSVKSHGINNSPSPPPGSGRVPPFFFTRYVAFASSTMQMFFNAYDRFPLPPAFFFLFRRDIFLTTRPLVENVSKAFPCTANTFNNPPFLISDFRS